jgi:tetratricopeptide (TPR) repeat protein
MKKAAKDYNSQGLELVNAGRAKVALDFFTKAIEEDPEFLEAFKNRGEALIKLNRVAEGEKDIQKAEGPKGPKKKPDKTIKKQKKVVEKYNLHEAEDLLGSLSDEISDSDDDLFLDDLLYDDDYSGDTSGNERDLDNYDKQVEEDNVLYDDSFSKIALGDELAPDTYDEQIEPDDILHDETFSDDETGDEQIVEETAPVSSETDIYSAILEYIGGMRQEVAQVRLFEPLENSFLIIDEATNDEQVVFFDQLTCLRVSGLPARISDKRKESCTKEIIETVDGKIYHELVHPEQDLDNLLICFSTDDQTPFTFTLFPKSIIKKRTQDKRVIDILLEKRFISKAMFQRVLQEFEQMKSMTLEKIIAKKARFPLAEIEEAIDQAQQGPMQGMQKEEILLFSGLVNEEEILEAVEHLENIEKLNIGQFLVEKGLVKEREVYISLAEKHRIPFVDLKGRKISRKSLASLPKNMIVNHEILPLALKDDVLLVASHYVDMTHLSEAIVKAAGCKHVRYVLSPPAQIKKIINLLYAKRK